MAGRGPAPKEPEARRNRAAPQRGEWVDLPPESGLEPPELPTGWSDRAAHAWRAWWTDPAATLWTSADVESVWQLLFLFELMMGDASKQAKLAGEVRLRMDGLGLTPKGKRDLRLRVVPEKPEEDAAPAARPASDRRRRLRVVG